MIDLCRKYAPQSLSEVRGQDYVVSQLRELSKSPGGRAFLFSGQTGVGKTATVWAWLKDLQPDLDDHDLRLSVNQLRPGSQGVSDVRKAMDSLNPRPLYGRFQTLLLNEADAMSDESADVFLDALERLNEWTLIFFTTNRPKRFDQRFEDRCIHYRFNDTREALLSPIRDLTNAIWMAETGEPVCPLSDDTLCPQRGNPSIRRAIRVIENAIRERASGKVFRPNDNGSIALTHSDTDRSRGGGMTMISPATGNPVRVGFASIEEAEEFLGVSRSTVNRLLSIGRLRRVKIGRLTKIDWSDLQAFKGTAC